MDDVPKVLRDIVKKKMSAKYGEGWRDQLKNERFKANLRPAQKTKLKSGKVEEWDITLLVHTLLYSSHFLLADNLHDVKLAGENNDQLVSTTDSLKSLSEGDLILCDVQKKAFKCRKVKVTTPSKITLNEGFEDKKSFKGAYKCTEEYFAVDELRNKRNQDVAHRPNARIHYDDFQGVVQTIKKSYKALNFADDRIDKVIKGMYSKGYVSFNADSIPMLMVI